MSFPNSSIVGTVRRLGAATGASLLLLTGLVLASASQAQDRSERPIGPGVRLLQWSDPAGPNALQAVEVDLSDPLIRLGVSLGGGEAMALEPLSRQAERLTRPDRYPIAGVNGDFFYYPGARQPGIPTNAALLGDEVLRSPFGRSCLVLPAEGAPSIRILKLNADLTLPDGARVPLTGVNNPRAARDLVLFTPRFGASTRTDNRGTEVYLEPEGFPLRRGEVHRARVRAVQQAVGDGAIQPGTWVLSAGAGASGPLKNLQRGDTVQVRVDFDPPLQAGDQVLGGGPRLVRDGKVSIEAEAGSINGSFASTRHPRTAVGFSGRKVFLVVVDGRMPGYSVGMSLPELARAMADLGCTDAVNLDGGGSTTLWVRGSLSNRPSDGRERPVSNGLLVFSTAPKGPPVRLVGQPRSLDLLPGAEVSLQAGGEDRHYNPVPVSGEVEWAVDPRLGRVEAGRFIAAAAEGEEPVAGQIQLASGAARGAIPVRVHPRPARLELLPAKLRLGPETQNAFRVRAFDAQGKPLVLPPAFRWETTGEIGEVSPDGTLRTSAEPGQGSVRVTLAGVTAEAQVEVALGASNALDDFESSTDWTVRLTAGTAGAARVAPGPARSGRKSLRLEYDFNGGSGTRAVYAQARRDLGRPLALKAWVYGDGQGTWLRARIRDAAGAAHTLDLARSVDWKDTWRELRLPLSEDLPTPLTLEALYVVEADTSRKPKGALHIDDLTVER